MITISLIQELLYIKKSLKKDHLSIDLSLTNQKLLTISINFDDSLNISYGGQFIWRETLNPDTSMFGVESTQNIFKIIQCIDKNDPSWREKYYYNDNVEK